jgi:CheY-specific phosphatase CheX
MKRRLKDVLGELANIISGNLKSDFLDADLACVISTPSITRGKRLQDRGQQSLVNTISGFIGTRPMK